MERTDATRASREELVAEVRGVVAHAAAGTTELEPSTSTIAAAAYYDAQRWQLEVDRIFKRVPIVLAWSAELPEPGTYVTNELVGVPVLLVRGSDSVVRGFVNMCSHRGAQVAEGRGSARRFTCPYHAWVYDQEGTLVGIRDAADFGPVDQDCLGLTPLQVYERAGVVFGHLAPDTELDIDAWLAGYGELLEHLDLAEHHVVGRRVLGGPNWKVAYDGYLDFYHLPILHKDSFGPDFFNQAVYRANGPHQRTLAPTAEMARLADKPEDEWPELALTSGVWTIFPHVSIARFAATEGLNIYQVAQLFPGEDVSTSTTVLTYLCPREPEPAEQEAVDKIIDFLEHVVRDEDYATGKRITKAVATGAKPELQLGRNEGGLQRFHGWVQNLIDCEDSEALSKLLA